MAYDPATARMVLFGGDGKVGLINETWTYDGATWTKQGTPESPSAREGASMAYEPRTEKMVLFGGWTVGGRTGESWTYDGATWTKQSPPDSPRARFAASMDYDPATGRLVLFGGLTGFGEESYETWTYGPFTKATSSLSTRSSGATTLGGIVKDSATLSGGGTPTGQITFRLYGPADETCAREPAYTSKPVAVEGSGKYDSPEFTPAAPGTYHWIASYSGDSNDEGAAGSCGEEGESVSVVAAAGPTATTAPPPSPASPADKGSHHQARLAIFDRPQGVINLRQLPLEVRCGEVRCTVATAARVVLAGLRDTVILHGRATLNPNESVNLELHVPTRVRQLLRGYLRHHRHLSMKLDVTVTMTAPGTPKQTAATVIDVWTLPGLR